MTSTEQEKEVVEFLQELVRTPSLSGDLAAVADVVERKMRSLDFDEVWRDEVGNVIAKRSGDSPGPKLLFDAHMDVVQVNDPLTWQHDPFGGEISGGRLWGRGATDTKPSLAGMIVGLGSMPREDFSGTIYVVGSLEEELIEGISLETVLEAIQPDGVVVGEPTDHRLAIGHKGRTRLIFTLKGRAAHTSSPEVGENAIVKAMQAMQRISAVPLLDDPMLGGTVMEPIIIRSSPDPNASTVPYECKLVYDRRTVRGETMETVLETHRKALEDLEGWEIDFDEFSVLTYTGKEFRMPDFHPGWAIEPDSDWVQLGLKGLELGGLEPVYYTAPYCTNAALTAGEQKIPTAVFGPSSISLAHITDEYIELEELIRGMRGFIGLAASLSKFGNL